MFKLLFNIPSASDSKQENLKQAEQDVIKTRLKADIRNILADAQAQGLSEKQSVKLVNRVMADSRDVSQGDIGYLLGTDIKLVKDDNSVKLIIDSE